MYDTELVISVQVMHNFSPLIFPLVRPLQLNANTWTKLLL